MLGLNQLAGFGASAGGAAGVITATYLCEANSITATGFTPFKIDSPSFTPTAGSFLLVLVACDNAGASGVSPFTGCSLVSGSLTFNTVATDTQNPAGATSGVTIVASLSAAVSGSSIAVRAGFNASLASRCIQVWQLTLTDATAITAASATTTGNGTTPSVTISAAGGDLVVGLLGVEARTVPTGVSGWNTAEDTLADTGAADTSIVMSAQTKSPATDGSQTYNPTFGATARDYAALVLALTPV